MLEAYLLRLKTGRLNNLCLRRNGIGGPQIRYELPVYAHEFIERMDLAFAAADLVVTRAGAGSISELCAAGKACIFVPSPNVAEDHQTHNAMALVKEKAGYMIPDKEATKVLMHTAIDLVFKESELHTLSENILQLSRPHAAEDIAKLVLEL